MQVERMAFEETREQQQMYNYFRSCIYIFLIIEDRHEPACHGGQPGHAVRPRPAWPASRCSTPCRAARWPN